MSTPVCPWCHRADLVEEQIIEARRVYYCSGEVWHWFSVGGDTPRLTRFQLDDVFAVLSDLPFVDNERAVLIGRISMELAEAGGDEDSVFREMRRVGEIVVKAGLILASGPVRCTDEIFVVEAQGQA